MVYITKCGCCGCSTCDTHYCQECLHAIAHYALDHCKIDFHDLDEIKKEVEESRRKQQEFESSQRLIELCIEQQVQEFRERLEKEMGYKGREFA